MLIIAAVLWKVVPVTAPPQAQDAYLALISSVFKLFITERILRARGLLALLIFAAFPVLWTSMVLPLSAPPLSLSHTTIGMFGLAGVAGALAARRAGRWADQGLGQRVTGISLGLLTLFLVAHHVCRDVLDRAGLWRTYCSTSRCKQYTSANQSLIFAARPDAQSRLVGAYMCFYSVGSALGAAAATQVYALWGWIAVSLLGALISATALVLCVSHVSFFNEQSRRISMKARHLLLALSITAIWGVNFSVIKLGFSSVDPFILAGIRFTLCALQGAASLAVETLSL